MQLSVSRREVQQSEKKTKQDFAFFALRGVEEEILQALPVKQEEEEEGRHGREKKEATTVATSRPSCAKNSSVSALISIVCFLLGRRGFWPRMVPGSGFESVSWENGH